MPLTRWLEELRHDLKVGIRQLVGAPAFTFVAATTLALGIGANAAVLGVTKSVLLDALPYPSADRLVQVFGGVVATPQRGPLTAATFREITARQRSFDRLTAFADVPVDMVFGSADGPLIARTAWVDSQFFETLGVSAARGRTFRPEDAGNGMVPLSGGQDGPDTASTVLLTDAAWRRLFGADPAILGRNLRVNGLTRTVVGVLPRGFVGPAGDVDFYFALDPGPVLADPVRALGAGWLGAMGRLRPGVSADMAARDVAAIWGDLVREYPKDNGSLGIDTVPVRQAMVGDTRTPLLVLMISAGLVLLIACANLAAALLSRALARRKEFAVRVALGAGPRRIVRQLLTESTLLAVGGGAVGLTLAAFALTQIEPLVRPALPAYAEISLDTSAFVAASALTVLTGLLFGLAPALAAGRRDQQSALGEESRGSSESRGWRHVRGALMAAQVALCVSLLVGAGLLARSLWAMTSDPLGFNPDGLLSASVRLPTRDYAEGAVRARFANQFLERLAAIPGVQGVASVTALPTTRIGRAGVSIPNSARAGDPPTFVLAGVVSDDYFRILQIPVLEGRAFGTPDRFGQPSVAIVSQSMARRFWPSGGALGSLFRLGPNPEAPLIAVIGIVGDVRNDRARFDAEPMVYLSNRQNAPAVVRVLLRSAADPLALVEPAKRALASIDAGLVLQQPSPLRAVIADGLANRRLPGR